MPKKRTSNVVAVLAYDGVNTFELGMAATTHWANVEALASRYPSVRVQPDVLYVDDGDVLTSAGRAAGLDLCLHIVRRDHGAEVANNMARRLVIAPHRDALNELFADFVPKRLPSFSSAYL